MSPENAAAVKGAASFYTLRTSKGKSQRGDKKSHTSKAQANRSSQWSQAAVTVAQKPPELRSRISATNVTECRLERADRAARRSF